MIAAGFSETVLEKQGLDWHTTLVRHIAKFYIRALLSWQFSVGQSSDFRSVFVHLLR
jgi:hypothetical protein